MSALSLDRINQIDMVDFLAFLGHHPEKISGAHYWYGSPLVYTRGDGDHFHVNRRTNRWYDFTLGAGYTLADFGQRYFPNEQTFIQNIQTFHETTKENVLQPEIRSPRPSSPTVQLEETYPIRSLVLIQQLWERRIPISVARRYCEEARYTRNDRSHCTLGLSTEAGGYVLFDKNHRYQIGPNSPTHYGSEKTEIAVFLDCMDMLTLASLQPNPRLQPDFLCLHQADNLPIIIPRLKTYSIIRLFFPNTTTGDRLTQAIQRDQPTAIDYRPLYNRYSCLNEWVCHFGKGNPPSRPPLSSNSSQCP